jgi:hypothetical protein
MAGSMAPARLRAGPANRMRYLSTNRRGWETFPGAVRAFGRWESYGFHIETPLKKCGTLGAHPRERLNFRADTWVCPYNIIVVSFELGVRRFTHRLEACATFHL